MLNVASTSYPPHLYYVYFAASIVSSVSLSHTPWSYVDCSCVCQTRLVSVPGSCLLDLQCSYHGKYQISINQIQFGHTHAHTPYWHTHTHTLVTYYSNMSLFLSLAKYLHSLVVWACASAWARA